MTTDCRTQLASMAIEELDKGDFLMATKILTTSIRLEPNNHELYFERSICHHKLGNYQASLDDANAAIRLNSSDYNIYYQRGLAMIGLSMFPEAVTSFKKAIELRAKQEDSKLSDIFKLLRDATNELNTARKRPGTTTTLNKNDTTTSNTSNTTAASIAPPSQSGGGGSQTPKASSSDPVDSTTDKPSPMNQQQQQQQQPQQPQQQPSRVVNPSTVNNNKLCVQQSQLVATTNIQRNNNQNATQIFNSNINIGTAKPTNSRVSSSALTVGQQQFGDSSHAVAIQQDGYNSAIKIEHNQLQHQQSDDLARQQPPLVGSPFEWNIRRSERIFLHNSSEPGTSGHNEEGTGATASNIQRLKSTGSNPSSVSSLGKGANKRTHDQTTMSRVTYQPNAKTTNSLTNGNQNINKPRNGTNSVVTNSETDVDGESTINVGSNYDFDGAAGPSQKRVMVTPSSSMPATGQSSAPVNAKEDSYSSKYKRLRRDRERARRGTTKLCTIKPGDLDELHRLSGTNSEKRFMRVIAPIDGWLYSGQLSVDDNNNNNNNNLVDGQAQPQYVVKLDGDSTGSSYLFSQETVLNDVIKEVRVKSVSELRKGARICCYWSRTYKCLSTGVVTSRTFEETKSLVSVKYDNGDLSALPLEDLRLLPPDYPKYMSNCDPLLLARSGDSGSDHPTAASGSTKTCNRIVVDSLGPPQSGSGAGHKNYLGGAVRNSFTRADDGDQSNVQEYIDRPGTSQRNSVMALNGQQEDADDNQDDSLPNGSSASTLEDDQIPPTSETIKFITGESSNLEIALRDDVKELGEADQQASGEVMLTGGEPAQLDNSRASSEENNYGVEYRPWVFEGPPKRTKRNGRFYRDTYSAIRRGNEVLKVGDSAELMPRDESILPFIAKIDGFWATVRGEMRVRVRWYYRLIETEGEPYELEDGENALFETDHFDENDVQSIWRTTRILSWTDYTRDHIHHVNKQAEGPKIFYLAGYYDPVRRIKHLRSDVKSLQ